MHEHMASIAYHITVHLLNASLVCVAALLLTSIGRGSATAKYWIWVATSLNFVLPLGAILDKSLAAHLSWARPFGPAGEIGSIVAHNAPVVVTTWLVGALLMFTLLSLRLRAEHRIIRSAYGPEAIDGSPTLLRGVPIRFARASHGPAVDGILRPHISLPKAIADLLNERELDAVLIHELTHARRRDNLIRLFYELGLCALWFNPLLWVAGSRLALYRELSCDESVIKSARGQDLVSALAKLANPEHAFLLQASASSFVSHRLAKLSTVQPQPKCLAASTFLALVFGAVLAGGVLGTVAHTACCFLAKK
jgi:beta-lactamase regulating signal transducer with metallopeptidase domain